MRSRVRRVIWRLLYPVIVLAWVFAEVPEFLVRLLYALGQGHAAWVRGYRVVNKHPATWLRRRAVIALRERETS